MESNIKITPVKSSLAPSEDELAAIVAAVRQLAQLRSADSLESSLTGANAYSASSAWRFSGRWWLNNRFSFQGDGVSDISKNI